MLDHEAEAVATRTLEAPATAGAGVQNLFLSHPHLWMKDRYQDLDPQFLLLLMQDMRQALGAEAHPVLGLL